MLPSMNVVAKEIGCDGFMYVGIVCSHSYSRRSLGSSFFNFIPNSTSFNYSLSLSLSLSLLLNTHTPLTIASLSLSKEPHSSSLSLPWLPHSTLQHQTTMLSKVLEMA
ncbi:hypothetical protein RJT34_06211 [Clitoria ternatea]|uniref:Uncharacterized protein n=1 Tax=Clitoria ternatea TaxID=43366 RepID=A0AAN9K2B5_CLITE